MRSGSDGNNGAAPAGSPQESGQALAEYSLILAFIAAACIIALGALGFALAGQLDAFAAAFP